MDRELAGLLVADAVDYSRRIEEDESAALKALEVSRLIVDKAIEDHDGIIISTAGDSVIARFPGAVAAVTAAQLIQLELGKADSNVFAFRIGIHFGDVVVTETDMFGDGLNVAARLEPLAPPTAICISSVVADQIAGKVNGEFIRVGRRKLKNINRPIEIYCWPESAARTMKAMAVRRRLPALAGIGMLAAAVAAGVFFAPRASRPTMPTGPRIAVLPFEEVGVAKDEAFFAQGLSRDVTAFLSEFSNLFVLASSSTAAFRTSDCATIRSELDADFILSGTVRRAGNKLRVTTAFTNANNCRQLNSPGPFDRDLSAESVLDVQLDIAQKVVAEIGSADAPIFDASLIRELESGAPENLSAYECVLLSFWFYENFAPDRHRRARDCLKGAVVTDPTYSLAWSRLAFAFIESKKYAIDTENDWAEQAAKAAQTALDLDPENPDAYYALAIRSQIIGEDRSVFSNYARKAVELNPNDSFI
ncbi:MAG: adenylate/guanylate cyclase domain-containing protein, partial [Bythopirellula sp.]